MGATLTAPRNLGQVSKVALRVAAVNARLASAKPLTHCAHMHRVSCDKASASHDA